LRIDYGNWRADGTFVFILFWRRLRGACRRDILRVGGAILRLGRHLGFIALLLAALLTAKAEAREFFASSAPADVRFVYAPDQSAPDSWLGLLLRQTGMDIWFVLMRDLL